ncbi:MAG TPA: SDR family oxidoreductase [Acidimicrobiia bacterium]|jgi:NAD(P)-dependent dehydrogenase (short-subunit alcohol dehydrogenase family)
MSSASGWFDGRVVVVTGGASGIGAATSRAFAAQGARVAVVDVNADGAAEVAASIGELATAHHTDVTDAHAVTAMASVVLDALGRVDVLVNNAGHWLRVLPFHLSEPEHWDDLFAVNLRHVFLVTRALLPNMLERGNGVVVNVSSIEGVRAYPPDPVYASAKAALNHFTASMAAAYGRKGVRFVGIAPDITNTGQVVYDEEDQRDPRWSWWAPVGRPGTPDDQADVIVALASDQFRFVTGAVVNTDGGTGVAGGWWWDDARRTFVNRPEGLRRA